MVLVKILKRRDASTLIVALVLAGIIGQALAISLSSLANKLIGIDYGSDGGFGSSSVDVKQSYIYPAVWAALQIVVLEILAWIVIGVEMLVKPSAKKK
jgi:hypothetical protein